MQNLCNFFAFFFSVGYVLDIWGDCGNLDRNPIEGIFCEKIYVATNSLFPRGEGQVVVRGQLWEVEVLRGNISKFNFSLSLFYRENPAGEYFKIQLFTLTFLQGKSCSGIFQNATFHFHFFTGKILQGNI